MQGEWLLFPSRVVHIADEPGARTVTKQRLSEALPQDIIPSVNSCL